MRPGQPLSLGYFQDRRLQRWVDAKLAGGTIDSVYVFSSAMARYVMHAKPVRRVLDMVDVDSEKWTAYAETRALSGAQHLGAGGAHAARVRAPCGRPFRSQPVRLRARMAAFRVTGAGDH